MIERLFLEAQNLGEADSRQQLHVEDLFDGGVELEQCDRLPAAKIDDRDASRADEARRRLLREAQAMAKLDHPNVIKVHDVGLHEGRVFIAMEFVEGQTLKGWLSDATRPWR